MTQDFEIKTDLVKNIPFLLDAILEIGAGLVLVTRPDASTGDLAFGWALFTLGSLQFIRKVKTFHLTNGALVVKRPLFPFPIAEQRFQITQIIEIKFINIKGRFGGPHLNIVTPETTGSYRIETTKKQIDEFDRRLRSLGLTPIRERM